MNQELNWRFLFSVYQKTTTGHSTVKMGLPDQNVSLVHKIYRVTTKKGSQ